MHFFILFLRTGPVCGTFWPFLAHKLGHMFLVSYSNHLSNIYFVCVFLLVGFARNDRNPSRAAARRAVHKTQIYCGVEKAAGARVLDFAQLH